MSDSSTFVTTKSDSLPLVPLRDMVVFPHMMAPFIIGREHSVKALEYSLLEADKSIFLVAQLDPKVDEPERQDMYDVGVVAQVVQNLKLPNGNVKVMVEGLERARLLELEEAEGAAFAEVEVFEIDYPTDDNLKVYINKVLGIFEQYAKLSHHLAFEGLVSTIQLDEVDQFTDRTCIDR